VDCGDGLLPYSKRHMSVRLPYAAPRRSQKCILFTNPGRLVCRHCGIDGGRSSRRASAAPETSHIIIQAAAGCDVVVGMAHRLVGGIQLLVKAVGACQKPRMQGPPQGFEPVRGAGWELTGNDFWFHPNPELAKYFVKLRAFEIYEVNNQSIANAN